MQAQSNNPPEEWRPIPGYSDMEVSSLGRVRRVYILRPHIISRRGRHRGYLAINLRERPGEPNKHRVIHRLVALAFLGEPPTPAHQVNHKDADTMNNDPANLEWVTCAENIRHAWRLRRIKPPPISRGPTNYRTRLTATSVREIRQAAGRVSTRDLAKHYSVTRSAIHHVQARRTWAYLD